MSESVEKSAIAENLAEALRLIATDQIQAAELMKRTASEIEGAGLPPAGDENVERGLQYVTPDGRVLSFESGDVFLVETLADGEFRLRRFCGGQQNESYAPMDAVRATLSMTAFIQGYQPPRRLVHLDKQSR